MLEKNAAWLSGLIAALVYAALHQRWSLPTGIHDAFAAAVNIAAIGVGFLLTANSILVSADDKTIIRLAKEAGVYKVLVRYMLSATYWCLMAAILSVIGLLYDPAWRLPWYPSALAMWMFFASGATASLFRVLLVFAQFLLGLAEE
jgi:hypothetical protein